LARVVYVQCPGVSGIQGIVDGDVTPAAVQKAVCFEIAISVVPDDLARVIDAGAKGMKTDGQGIIEGSVGIDRHDTGSVVIVSVAENLNRKAEGGGLFQLATEERHSDILIRNVVV
jgi:hypothetical protein